MSTQIVDNFQLNVAKPIDSRMVTYGTASRNSLQFIYEGLRVYDVVNKAPYVYINSGWQQESSSGAISGGGGGGGSVTAGTTNRLVKYATSTTIGDSAILDRGTYASPNIGIGKIPAVGSALDVNGRINANTLNVSTTITATNFVGELNGSYISVKSLSIDKIVAGLDNQVLKTIGTGNNATVTWVNDNNTTIAISNETSSANTHYLLFSNSSSGSVSLNTNNGTSRLIGVKPSTSQILASADVTTNSQSAPGYAFSGTTTAGLYGNTTEIGLSFNSTALLKLDTTKLSILDTAGTTVLSSTTGGINFGSATFIKSTAGTLAAPDYTWQGDTSTGIYRPAAGQIGFSTTGTRKLIIAPTKNEFFGGLTINGRIGTTGTPTDTYITDGGLIIDGSGAGLNLNGLASVRDLSVIATAQFKPYPQSGLPDPAPGKVLTSDADGYATWQPPQSVPYGTIIMWLSTTIPSGWRICGSYNTGSGASLVYKSLFVYIEGAYIEVPVLVDKVIMAGTTITGGGDKSPKEALTSGALIKRSSSGAFSYTQVGTVNNINYEYRGVKEVQLKGKGSGGVQWDGYDLLYDGERGMLFTNTGITKYQQLIFIIKVSETALPDEDGHFKIEASESNNYEYNNQQQLFGGVI